jgi:hypothetical protein
MSFSSKVAKNDKTNKFPAFLSTFHPYPAISKNVKKILNFHPSKRLSFPHPPPQVQKMHIFHTSRKSLTFNHFRFLYIFQPSKKRLFGGSKATNEVVKDGK